MSEVNKNQVINAFNRIAKEEATEDKVPMTCGDYVIKLAYPEDYVVLSPFIQSFITRSYAGEVLNGSVEEVVFDCCHILMGDKEYLSFKNKEYFQWNIKKLGEMIADYFTLSYALSPDEEDDEDLFKEE